MKTLSIKNATLKEMDALLALAKVEGWNPGLDDAKPFYEADPHGFFIGEIDGKMIGCISAVAYNQDFGFMGFYIVVPKYRAMGFGIQLWNHAICYMDNRSIGLDGVLAQQSNYEKSHFKLYYKNIRFQGTAIQKESSNLLKIDEVPFKKVLDYDTKVFGLERGRFLQNWFQMPNSLTLVHFQNDTVSGYGTIRKCHEGYKIGPLFADSADIAEKLYAALSKEKSVFIDIPETNQMAIEFAKKSNFKKVFETVRMYTSKPPSIDLKRVFGVTTFELG